LQNDNQEKQVIPQPASLSLVFQKPYDTVVQGWGLQGLASTKFGGLGLGLELVWPWPRKFVIGLGLGKIYVSLALTSNVVSSNPSLLLLNSFLT
jgi:hypothetical protein